MAVHERPGPPLVEPGVDARVDRVRGDQRRAEPMAQGPGEEDEGEGAVERERPNRGRAEVEAGEPKRCGGRRPGLAQLLRQLAPRAQPGDRRTHVAEADRPAGHHHQPPHHERQEARLDRVVGLVARHPERSQHGQAAQRQPRPRPAAAPARSQRQPRRQPGHRDPEPTGAVRPERAAGRRVLGQEDRHRDQGGAGQHDAHGHAQRLRRQPTSTAATNPSRVIRLIAQPHVQVAGS